MTMKQRFGVGTLAFLWLFSTIVTGQETTGTLRGFVNDKQGEPLPGVSVEIQSPSLMAPRAIITDSRGAFRFLYLPPGTYILCAKIENFGVCWQKGLRIEVGKTTSTDVVLEQAGLETTITVTAVQPLIDIESSDKSYTLPIQVLNALPISPRMNFYDAWQLLPGVYGGSNPNVNAADLAYVNNNYQRDSQENKVMMDGMELNDTMSGNVFAVVNYEAIQEIGAKTAGAPAEYGNARSSFMTIVSKSGGNEFQGSFLFQLKPESWVWVNVAGATAPKVSYANPALTFSGPILKDRMWFLASLKYDGQNSQFANTRAVPKIVEKSKRWMPYLKLTFQPHDNHTVSLIYQNDAQEIEPTTFDAMSSAMYALPEAMGRRENGGPLAGGSWRWIISNSVIFNFAGSYFRKPQNNYAINDLPQIQYREKYLGNIVKYAQAAGEDYYSVRENALLNLNLTWFKDDLWNSGAHEFKFGIEFRPYGHVVRTRSYNRDGRGFYSYKYGMDYGTYGLTAPYLYEATEVFPGKRYDNEVLVSGVSAYLQDNWVISKNLSLSLGLRWEKQREYMYGRDELPTWMDAIFAQMRENVEFDDHGLAPRLGVTYNWDKIGVFKFHVGRYFEQVGTGDYNNYARTIAFSTWRVSPADFGKGAEALKIYTQGQLAYAADYNNPNLRMEYNHEAVFSYERRLFWNLTFDTTFIYRKIYSSYQQDVNTVFKDGKFVDRKFPGFDTIWMRSTYSGSDRKTYYDFKSIQFNLKRNFVGRWGFMANFTRFWRSYVRRQFDSGGTDQFVYANPGDLTQKDYGVLWAFHGSAFYRLPLDFMIATFINGNSGTWVNDVTGDYGLTDAAPRVTLSNGRLVNDILWTARNSYLRGKVFGEFGRWTEPVWNINVRLQKGLNISKIRFETSVDFFNVFNWSAYQGYESADIRNARYVNKITPQSARAVQLNLRVEY